MFNQALAGDPAPLDATAAAAAGPPPPIPTAGGGPSAAPPPIPGRVEAAVPTGEKYIALYDYETTEADELPFKEARGFALGRA